MDLRQPLAPAELPALTRDEEMIGLARARQFVASVYPGELRRQLRHAESILASVRASRH